MRGDTRPERLRLLRLPHPAERRRRQDRPGTEAAQGERMARLAPDRLGGVGNQIVEPRRKWSEGPAPPVAVGLEVFGGRRDRSTQDTGRAVVEGMGAVDRRL